MLGKANSPTARLLRSSRLFSLPPPLPKPDNQAGTSFPDRDVVIHSDSATLPYPVSQAIATPQSSQARGDWGLKRPLPLRTTAQSSTSALRIASIDSTEHITDFESAADHTKTLEKWQEIGLPVVRHSQRGTVSDRDRKGRDSSVFESDIDNTAKSRIQNDGRRSLDKRHERWKFEGPWIAGMSESAFAKFVTGMGRHRKAGFLSYLRERIRRDAINAERISARDEGRSLSPDFQDTFNISEEFFQDKLKRMRDKMIEQGSVKLNSELGIRIQEFFDLPLLSEDQQINTKSTFTLEGKNAKAGPDPEAFGSGPTQTHPSAGFSYLRTQAHIPNHPLLGPQKPHHALQGRLLKSRGGVANDAASGRFGVAGVVAESQADPSAFAARSANWADPTVAGGAKMWAEVKRLSVNARGRIDASIEPADPDAVAVAEGRLPPRAAVTTPPPFRRLSPVQPLEFGRERTRGPSRFYAGRERDALRAVERVYDEQRHRGRGSSGLDERS
ncbi:MAG: hypothetical protein Q9165_005294 [Trypethelium subeluteriae]